MLVFLHVGGGGYNWYIASLFLLLALNSSSILHVLEFGISAFSNVGRMLLNWYKTQEQNTTLEYGLGVLNLVLISAFVFFCCWALICICYVLCIRISTVGLRNTLDEILRICLINWRGFAFDPEGLHGINEGLETRRKRSERNAQWMKNLKTETYESIDDLKVLSIRRLKDRLRRRQVSGDGLVEKRDLVQALLASDNTTSKSCSICFNDYVSGEQLKVLPCRHKYHKECIEQWFRTAPNFLDAPPKCPYCNTSIIGRNKMS
eukprot:g6754.t1